MSRNRPPDHQTTVSLNPGFKMNCHDTHIHSTNLYLAKVGGGILTFLPAAHFFSLAGYHSTRKRGTEESDFINIQNKGANKRSEVSSFISTLT